MDTQRVILSICAQLLIASWAILSCFWPKELIPILYWNRDREWAQSRLFHRIFRVVAGLAATGLLISVISELMGKGR